MACDVNGNGCKVCPGIWVAGFMLLAMLVQSLFFWPTNNTKPLQNDVPANLVSEVPNRAVK
jgi:hypothetical protein